MKTRLFSFSGVTPTALRFAGLGVVSLLALSCAGQALAQTAECVELGKLFNRRQSVIEQINGFQKKQVSPDVACSAFTKLGQLTTDTIKAIEKDGAWCHVPGEILPNLQTQTAQIAEARKNSCGVADQQRKAQSDAKQNNPLSGGDSVIGGQIKMPKGAL